MPTETPWPIVFVAAMGAVGLLIAWSRKRKSGLLAGMAVCAAVIAGAFAIDESVVTPREKLETSLFDLLHAFRDKNIARIEELISAQSPGILNLARVGSERLTVTNMRVTDIDYELLANGQRARTRFRVNANLAEFGQSQSIRRPTMWEGKWQDEAGEWKLIEIERLDPITEKTADDFATWIGGRRGGRGW